MERENCFCQTHMPEQDQQRQGKWKNGWNAVLSVPWFNTWTPLSFFGNAFPSRRKFQTLKVSKFVHKFGEEVCLQIQRCFGDCVNPKKKKLLINKELTLFSWALKLAVLTLVLFWFPSIIEAKQNLNRNKAKMKILVVEFPSLTIKTSV